MTDAERKAWNDAIEVAARKCDKMCAELSVMPEMALREVGSATSVALADAIRSLAIPEPRDE